MNIYMAANEIAHALGHLHALTEEEVSIIPSLRALHFAWIAKGVRLNDRPGAGLPGMEGWEEKTDDNTCIVALCHTTAGGRLRIHVDNHIFLTFSAGIFEDAEGRALPNGATVATVTMYADKDGEINQISVGVDSALIEGREDRVSLLWRIDRAMNGFISGELMYMLREDADHDGVRRLLIARHHEQIAYDEQRIAEQRAGLALLTEGVLL